MEGDQGNAAHVPQPQQRPQVRARAQAVAIGQAPVRLPEGGLGAAAQVRTRSVFDESVRGMGAQVQQIPLRTALFPVQGTLPQISRPAPPRVLARLGQPGQVTPPPQQQRTEIERVIQRELPPVGLSRQEAAAIAAALKPAIETSLKAVAERVSCGKVDSFMIQEVRALKDFLERFVSLTRADERTERLSADDFSKIDEVLACQSVYEQVSNAKTSGTTTLLIGALVAGAVVLALVS